MSDYGWVASVVAGVLTGGTSAGTTFLAVFKDIKKRLHDLETHVGSDKAEPRTGFFSSISTLTEQVRRIRREIDGWDDQPPDWASRGTRRSSVNFEEYAELERRFDQKMAAFTRRLQQLEDDLTQMESRFISQDRYEEDSRRRAQDLEKIKDSLATANSWQRGILIALGYGDEGSNPTYPTFPPRLLPPRPRVRKEPNDE